VQRRRLLALCAVAALVALLALPQGTAFAHSSAALHTQTSYAPQSMLCIANPNGSGCASQCQLSPSHANCDGKDPSATNCSDDGKTIGSSGIWDGGTEVALVDLRWSNTCQTNWARVTDYASTTYTWAELENNHDTISSTTYGINCGPQSSGNVCYTVMYYAPTENMMACGTLNRGYPPNELKAAWWNPGWVNQNGQQGSNNPVNWTCP